MQAGAKRSIGRVGLALAWLCAGLPPAVLAGEERKLGAAEIEALLSNRTALGENRGKATRQYFDPKGITIYLEQGAPPSRGRWRVDEERDQYCSYWTMGGWSCYDVTTDGQRHYWTLPDGDYHSPFTTVDGYQPAF